ncbi:hypothetical protein RHGRI_001482 [Rhododendron griersonianum]|uniref:Aminotransferase-like plant mobile domain-containing protein n=1 Tax=Rhododendron griersonianum TaxID=479676 RepID=A0AAV6LKV5_9ERIC|nr:hypothetical protein RHGRI_001482 [Rhododendron griersonianum]
MDRVIASGVLPLAQIAYKYCNKVLMSAFVERWHPETNSFHFGFGEMTITLEDVLYLVGLPVEGLAVHAEVHSWEDCVALVHRCLGVTVAEASDVVSCGGVELHWLKNTFMNVKVDATDERVDYCARAFLLRYAWGVGALGFLYRQLGQASRSHVKQMGGYTTLLEVVFDPYKERRQVVADITLYTGCICCMIVVEPYLPDRVLRQFGLVQLVPGPLLAPLRGTRGSTSATYSVVYQYTDALWQNWRDHTLHEDKRVPVRPGIPWESHQDYLS